MTDYEQVIADRVHKIRGMWEIDFTGCDDDAVHEGIMFQMGEMQFLILPTAGDDLLMIDIMSFVNGEKREQRTMMVRDR